MRLVLYEVLSDTNSIILGRLTMLIAYNIVWVVYRWQIRHAIATMKSRAIVH